MEELTRDIFAEASSSFNNSTDDSVDQGIAATEQEQEDEISEEERIIREMDRDLPTQPSRVVNTRVSRELQTSTTFSSVPTPSSSSDLLTSTPSSSSTTTSSDSNENIQMITTQDKISIKLKYLNDEIKIVECYLNESLGNFKK